MPSYLLFMGPHGLIRGDSPYRGRSGWFDLCSWYDVRVLRPNVGVSPSRVIWDASFTPMRKEGVEPLDRASAMGLHLPWLLLEVTGRSGTELWGCYEDVVIDTLAIKSPGDDSVQPELGLKSARIRTGTGVTGISVPGYKWVGQAGQ